MRRCGGLSTAPAPECSARFPQQYPPLPGCATLSCERDACIGGAALDGTGPRLYLRSHETGLRHGRSRAPSLAVLWRAVVGARAEIARRRRFRSFNIPTGETPHDRQDALRQDLGRPCRPRGRGRHLPSLHRPPPRPRGDQPAGLRGAAHGRPQGPRAREDDRRARPQRADDAGPRQAHRQRGKPHPGRGARQEREGLRDQLLSR